MKCIHYILLSLLILAPATSLADDLWEMQQLSVLTFDNRYITVEADEDYHGIRMLFSNWTPDSAQKIESELSTTDIDYALYPNRQARMTVELYSDTASLRFNAKQQRNTVQIVVGNSRPELEALDLLLHPDSRVPLADDLQIMLKNQDIAGARKALILQSSEDEEVKGLIQNRITVLEAALRDGVAPACNPAPKFPNSPETIESTFLTAWCQYSQGNTDEAERMLSEMQAFLSETPDTDKNREEVLNRIIEQRRKILLFTLLSEARRHQPSVFANTFLRFADDYVGNFFTVNILEVVADNLNTLGIGDSLNRHSDRILSRLKDDDLKRSAPVLAETYLNSGDYVRARDTASYFLEKDLPTWARGRLLRVRGRVNLQEGNWRAAATDFDQANQFTSPSPVDELALIEAHVRLAQAPQTLFEMNDNNDTALDDYYRQWAARLSAEAKLDQGKHPDSAELAHVPDYKLYFALKSAKQENNTRLVQQITETLSDRKGSWATLASIVSETGRMEQQLTELINDSVNP